MPDYSFIFDGTNAGVPTIINNVLADLSPSTVTATFYDFDLLGTVYGIYAFGVGAALENVTFDVVLPAGWSLQVIYDSPAIGGLISTSLYDELNSFKGIFNVSGGQMGNISNACFTGGSSVSTPNGPRRIEDLEEGDLVLTRDRGPQPLRWIGFSTLNSEALTQFPELRPVQFRADALGKHEKTLVSPNHRILVSGWRANLLYDAPEVVVPAKSLINDTTICILDVEEVNYYYLLFDHHEIICVDGV